MVDNVQNCDIYEYMSGWLHASEVLPLKKEPLRTQEAKWASEPV
jgi:hypothetical protein